MVYLASEVFTAEAKDSLDVNSQDRSAESYISSGRALLFDLRVFHL